MMKPRMTASVRSVGRQFRGFEVEEQPPPFTAACMGLILSVDERTADQSRLLVLKLILNHTEIRVPDSETPDS